MFARRNLLACATFALASVLIASAPSSAEEAQLGVVDATSLRGRVMCGYQGWFRCPKDPADMGWIHWSRDHRRLAPDTLTFEMWPDVSGFANDELFAAPGFTHANGSPAHLFSSDSAGVVLRHFQWMRDYGIDGAWLQHFVVDLPGQKSENRYVSRMRVLRHVADAARQTGRAWALSYDIAGSPTEKIFDAITADWKKFVDDGLAGQDRYLHEGGKPVVQVWGFYWNIDHNAMTAELGNRLIDFFAMPGKYSAFLAGGGNWDWRRNPDPQWQAMYRRLGAYGPWNVGNVSIDKAGVKHASTDYWIEDRKEFEKDGHLWLPVVYPGFSWDNLQKKPPGTTNIPRRRGEFLWEQFHKLAEMKETSVYIAMFDEVDEGTAIFKVSDAPPTQGHFVGLEGMPSDWYLRLVGEGAKMLRGERPISAQIPIKP